MKKTIKGFKGFDKDMRCQGFQYEVGKTYETDKAVMCEKGFHFCEHPLDVLSYYPPTNGNRFLEVVGSGDTKTKEGEDSKVCCTEIQIGGEVSLNAFVKASISFVMERIKKVAAATTGDSSPAATTGFSSAAATTGNYSAAATTGDSSPAATTGNSSPAATTGDYSAAQVGGGNSIACGIGRKNKARGKLGCWLVLAEWIEVNGEWTVKGIKSAKVDGEKINVDAWYEVTSGKFVEVK